MHQTTRSKWEFPNFAVLEDIITVSAIQQYPKLALLIFDSIFPYIDVFDNRYVSFQLLCMLNNLIAQEPDTCNFDQLKKKIKLCDGASRGKEQVLNYFLHQYRNHIT